MECDELCGSRQGPPARQRLARGPPFVRTHRRLYLEARIPGEDYASETPDEELRACQDRITGQDIPIVESQRPEKLPLDLQAELHLRSDKIAVAYRKWLRQLGLSFGTS